MLKFGAGYNNRERDFSHRRFRFIPLNLVRFDCPGVGSCLAQAPEDIFTPANIGPRFELREETRSTDFYAAEQRVGAGFGMVDLSLSSRSRLIAGALAPGVPCQFVLNTCTPFFYGAIPTDVNGNPTLETLVGVLNALGLQLTVQKRAA